MKEASGPRLSTLPRTGIRSACMLRRAPIMRVASRLYSEEAETVVAQTWGCVRTLTGRIPACELIHAYAAGQRATRSSHYHAQIKKESSCSLHNAPASPTDTGPQSECTGAWNLPRPGCNAYTSQAHILHFPNVGASQGQLRATRTHHHLRTCPTYPGIGVHAGDRKQTGWARLQQQGGSALGGYLCS